MSLRPTCKNVCRVFNVVGGGGGQAMSKINISLYIYFFRNRSIRRWVENIP